MKTDDAYWEKKRKFIVVESCVASIKRCEINLSRWKRIIYHNIHLSIFIFNYDRISKRLYTITLIIDIKARIEALSISKEHLYQTSFIFTYRIINAQHDRVCIVRALHRKDRFRFFPICFIIIFANDWAIIFYDGQLVWGDGPPSALVFNSGSMPINRYQTKINNFIFNQIPPTFRRGVSVKVLYVMSGRVVLLRS